MPIILNTKYKNGSYYVPKEETKRFTTTPLTDKSGSRIYFRIYENRH